MKFQENLGKITDVKFGQCSDRPFLLGIWLTLSWGSCNGVCVNQSVNMSPECKWGSIGDRERAIVGVMDNINQLLEDAKVHDTKQLLGKPIMVKQKGLGQFYHWDDFRILTEVL